MGRNFFNINNTHTTTMRIITNPQLLEAICEVLPVRIAVAYIGIDWREYIDESCLDEVIVSPTIGSNPRAIRQLVELLGWDKVHFLDALHAKFYIGKKNAAFGSFNLSRNGICAQGLEELGVITADVTALERLNYEFTRLLKLAAGSYPSVQDKEGKLEELHTQRNRAIAEGVLKDENRPTQITDYIPTIDSELYIVWWRDDKVEKDYECLSSQDPQLNEASFDNVVEDWATVLEKDEIKPGSWILLWKARMDGMPNCASKPKWLYVHQSISGAVKEDPYSKIIIQRRDKNRPAEPFSIQSSGFVRAFRDILCTDDFAALREKTGELWSVQGCQQETTRFIDSVKKKLTNGSI
jgi:hypothetical protein